MAIGLCSSHLPIQWLRDRLGGLAAVAIRLRRRSTPGGKGVTDAFGWSELIFAEVTIDLAS